MQKDSDVTHKYVDMLCNKTQFPSLQLFCPHTKPHGVRGLGKHYHMRFDPNLGHVTFTIRQISCAYDVCMLMLDKTRVHGLPLQNKLQYQPVTE